jgi:hypothetical protein
MPASAFHDKTYGSIERGNVLGDRSSVRQSRYFRQYESGNAVKSILGTDNLRWDVERKEGVFQGHAVYDGSRQEYDNEAAARAAADQQADRQPQTCAPVQHGCHSATEPQATGRWERPLDNVHDR